MPFDELKAKQAVMWGTGPYEAITAQIPGMGELLVERLEPRPSERWLDVASGTGKISILAARRGANVTGADLAPALVERARELAEAAGVDVRFEVADCERLPYEDGSFDVVSSAIGHMFAPDHDAAARELARVCRPGGRLGLACWRGESGIGDIFRVMAPFQPPRPAGVGNPFDWGREDYVREKLGDAFELEFEEADTPQTGESGAALWELFSTSYGPTKTLADSLEPERREELQRAWVELYERHRVDGGISQPRLYLLTIGRRR